VAAPIHLDDEQAATGAQHPGALGEPPELVGPVLEGSDAEQHVEVGIREGQLERGAVQDPGGFLRDTAAGSGHLPERQVKAGEAEVRTTAAKPAEILATTTAHVEERSSGGSFLETSPRGVIQHRGDRGGDEGVVSLCLDGAVRGGEVRREHPRTRHLRGRPGDDLDRDCRAHDVENLFVTDASFMPSGGAAPHTFTVYANAFRVAREVIRQLGGSPP
jgi:choline dehydrogenase-like flavoprotein